MSNTSFNQKGVSLYYQVETYIRTKIESGECLLDLSFPQKQNYASILGSAALPYARL